MQSWLLSLACSNDLLPTADGNSARAKDDQRELRWKSYFSRRRAVITCSRQPMVTAQEL
jgi:hypothetical protein